MFLIVGGHRNLFSANSPYYLRGNLYLILVFHCYRVGSSNVVKRARTCHDLRRTSRIVYSETQIAKARGSYSKSAEVARDQVGATKTLPLQAFIGTVETTFERIEMQ
jgi:hypothetical protein